LRNPLYRNSLYIFSSNLLGAGMGFLFWMFAAKTYSMQDVGVATALISSVMLIVGVSRLGLEQSLIRFFPEGNKGSIYTTTAVVTTSVAFLLGILFTTGVTFWSPEVGAIGENLPIYLLVIGASSMLSLSGFAMIAIRRSDGFLVQSIILGARVLLVFLLIPLGAMGLFFAFGISVILGSLYSYGFLHMQGIRPKSFSGQYLKSSFKMSSSSYASQLFLSLPPQILPIIVIGVLGASAAGSYYLAFTVASIVFMMPLSIGVSLFVEGSHGEDLIKNTKKSLSLSIPLLIVMVSLVYVLGGWILGFFSSSYVDSSLDLLRIMVLSSFSLTIVETYIYMNLVKKNVREVLITSALFCVIILVLSYILMGSYGLIGVGYAWFFGYGAVAVIISIKLLNELFGINLLSPFSRKGEE
jgi:O-antigen/teichoic acid export membrane protein